MQPSGSYFLTKPDAESRATGVRRRRSVPWADVPLDYLQPRCTLKALRFAATCQGLCYG
jgi:hypothetical protein